MLFFLFCASGTDMHNYGLYTFSTFDGAHVRKIPGLHNFSVCIPEPESLGMKLMLIVLRLRVLLGIISDQNQSQSLQFIFWVAWLHRFFVVMHKSFSTPNLDRLTQHSNSLTHTLTTVEALEGAWSLAVWIQPHQLRGLHQGRLVYCVTVCNQHRLTEKKKEHKEGTFPTHIV